MSLDNLKYFLNSYGLILIIVFLSFCIALPAAAEIEYKHRNKAFTRLAQVLLVIIFTLLISFLIVIIAPV